MIDYIYKLFPNLHEQNYTDQKKAIDNHISIWASGWEKALEEKNIPVLTIPTNIPLLLEKWAEENNLPLLERLQIIIEMLKRFLPDVLFYDLYDGDLLKQIKVNIPSIKLVALWKGSPPVGMEIFNHVDLTISCAPEEVEHLNKIGIKSEHLHHAFNKNVLNSESQINKEFELIFIGQIYRAVGFHLNRDKILREIVKEMELKIFSSANELGVSDFLYHIAKKLALALLLPFYFSLNQVTGKYSSEVEKAKKYPFFPYSLKLKRSLCPTVYGKKMYDVIRNTKVVLNIHADSSPLYASNMRLFETTGVGSCLLTDWKVNINELFREDTEVVTFRSEQECVEKAKWLLSHDEERNKIALAGQQRVFSSHLYEHRAPEFLDIVNKHMK